MSQPRITPRSRRLVPVAAAVLLLGRAGLSAEQVPPGGTVQEATISSKIYPPARHLWVYTPVDYPKSCGAGCNLVLTKAHRTPPTVAILFDNVGALEIATLAPWR